MRTYNRSAQLPKDENGNKLYPVGRVNTITHKIEYAYNKVSCNLYDAEAAGDTKLECKLYDEKQLLLHLLDVIRFYQKGGTIYAAYKDGQQIREYAAAYDATIDTLTCARP